MSMSLRNELRQPLDNQTLYTQTYNWQTWYPYMKQGAAAINAKNPAVLIFLSGLDSDTTLSPVVQGTALTPDTAVFQLGDFPAHKLVLELHNYDFSGTANCTSIQSALFVGGFSALTGTAANEFPMVVTEWGYAEDNTTWQGAYASCLRSYLPAQKAGWMIWVLAGSYYVRQGTQDYDESWGLLTHDWSRWRSEESIQSGLIPMVNASLSWLSSSNQTVGSGSGNHTGGGESSGKSDARRRFGTGEAGTSFLLVYVFALVMMLIFWS
jgi:Cellulase (glycosyl hydrolase family 5)